VFAVRLAVVFIHPRSGLPAHLCFALSPLALAFQARAFSGEYRHLGWTPLAVAVVTPFALRALIRNTSVVRRRLRYLVVYLCFPIAAYSYVDATSLTTAEGKPRFSFFEETYRLVPASEMLRGRTPYRDIIPAHGLIQDGLLDVLLLRTGPETIGRSLSGRGAIGALNSIACYALAVAATGSPEAGIVAFFLSASMGTADGSPRVLPALLLLAFMVAAVRRRNPPTPFLGRCRRDRDRPDQHRSRRIHLGHTLLRHDAAASRLALCGRELYWPLGPKDSNELSVPPRARGACWFEADVVTVRAAGAYIDRLAPNETFFNFTNHGLLYFLFDRRCPVPQLEVAFLPARRASARGHQQNRTRPARRRRTHSSIP
jgi:hypothetical protein